VKALAGISSFKKSSYSVKMDVYKSNSGDP
jgi:hypothetical protein